MEAGAHHPRGCLRQFVRRVPAPAARAVGHRCATARRKAPPSPRRRSKRRRRSTSSSARRSVPAPWWNICAPAACRTLWRSICSPTASLSVPGPATRISGRTQCLGALTAAVRGFDPRRPVRLYVFDPRWYGTVIAALRERRLAITELSIPAALRSPDGAGWSSAFRTLAARGLDAGAVPCRPGAASRRRRRAEGRQSEWSGRRRGYAYRRPAPASPSGSPHGLAVSMAVVVPLFGLAVVLAIEARERRRLMIPSSVPSL